ncbi:hypothetical protein H0H92_014435 [Tricholoma furcatifolium]|nr:hypothetical protein H0H92_014435 [Tricholoma furcatifolium]
MHYAIPVSKRKLADSSAPSLAPFSTSTPARVRSPPPPGPFPSDFLDSTQISSQGPYLTHPIRHPHAPLPVDQPDVRAFEHELEIQDEDLLMTARACVDAREFTRAVHILRDCKSSKAPPNHPLVQMFQTKTLIELHNPSDHELGLCSQLLTHDFFPNSLWIMSLRAGVLYHLHDFDQAETQFEKILALDPYRIDDIDVYSNILYVSDKRLKLSRLAHEFLALDKDRPEVCCLVAWTLMGHEYVEMKNSHAAIEAYRRAVGKFLVSAIIFSVLKHKNPDVNRKDYRAWYGLGQAYELLNMHNYALHYYQQATALRSPYDVRLWQAQGMCYEEIGRLREAVECLKHALIPADPHEITINLKLAKLHFALEEPAEAMAYHRRIVEDYARSSLEVAEYQMRIANGDLDLARDYLERVANSNAEEVGRAAELLKKVKAAIQARSSGMPAASDVETKTVADAADMSTDSIGMV